jgi:branched-chain amino acid transport system permease protein
VTRASWSRSLVDPLESRTRHRVIATLLVLAPLPWILPYSALAVNIVILGLFSAGFNLVYGYAGILSFGHAALFGAGAYGCGIALAMFGLPWWLGLLAGVTLATGTAAVLGALALRTRGIYGAMVTLALAQCAYYVAYQWSGVTGGENGLRGINVGRIGPDILRIDLLNPTTRFYVVLLFAGAALALLSRVLDSPYGATLEAVRENERRAQACGIDVVTVRWVAFVLSGAICGLAGALQAIHLSTVGVDTLHYLTSGQVLMMTLLGGAGTFFGPFVGAAAFTLIEHVVTGYTVHWQLVAGTIFILLVLFLPRGIWGTLTAGRTA